MENGFFWALAKLWLMMILIVVMMLKKMTNYHASFMIFE